MKSDYLLKLYKFSLKNSKREKQDQLRLTKTMIRVFLFLVIGALLYAAIDNLTVATLIKIAVPVVLITLVLNLFFSIERQTPDIIAKLRD